MTDNAMLEKCARAAFKAHWPALDYDSLPAGHAALAYEFYPRITKAVIRALMEPTPEMIEAMSDEWNFDNEGQQTLGNLMQASFAAALRTLLPEEPQP